MTPNGKVEAVGVLTVEKYRMGEARPYETLSHRNALTTAGKNHLLERGAGISTSNPLSGSSLLRIKNSGGTQVALLSGTEAGYPQHSTGASSASVSLRWRDGSTNTYSAHTLEVWFAGDSIQLNSLTPALGTKPTNEAWVYTFTLTFNVGSSSLVVAGLDRWLKCVTGVESNTFNSSRTELRIFSDSGQTTEVLPFTTSATPSRSSQTISWVWTVAAGVGTGTWTSMKVRNSSGPVELFSGNLSSPSAKGALTQRTFTFSFSL